MSKKNDHTLLLPGSNGWEVWSFPQNGPAQCLAKTEQQDALDLTEIPHGPALTMAFSVRSLTSLQLWSPTSELESASDLVNLHVEKVGLAQLEDLGSLHQFRPTSQAGADTLLCIDILKAPKEGSLPSRSPNHFTISPLAYPFPPSSTVIWSEFGRWMVAFTNEAGHIIHYQGSTATQLEVEMIQEIQFTIAQLQLQKALTAAPSNFVIWTDNTAVPPAGFQELLNAIGPELKLLPRPTPQLPSPGQLLPADTRAERLNASKKKQRTLLFSIAALLLLSLISFGVIRLISLEKQLQDTEARAESLKLSIQPIQEHITKWEELEAMVDDKNSPISMLTQTAKLIPNQQLRFRRAEFIHQPVDEGIGTSRSITIEGSAPDFKIALEFDERLQKSTAFDNLIWENAPPSKSKEGWKFVYRATVPVSYE